MKHSIGLIVRRRVEVHGGAKLYCIDHIRDGQEITSWCDYAWPDEVNANPCETASPSETSRTSPLNMTLLEDTSVPH